MKFGIFYEHQLPKPWTAERNDRVLLEEAFEQCEVADRLGYDYVWEVEHHFLEEYSHSSAPEVFLAAVSQRTKNIRLGHGIINMLPGVNHPARVAERLATLDLVSNGRVDWGTGESSARLELEGFDQDPAKKRAMWTESVRECARMMALEPYPGFDGEFFRMPCRNVMPKPVQKPHPPLWVACSSRETIHLAAQLGMGALTFSFADPTEVKYWVEDYYTTFKAEAVPLGAAANPNIAMVTSFSVHPDADEAVARGRDGFRFFTFALAHYYFYGMHQPGRTNIWDRFNSVEFEFPVSPGSLGGIGTPETVAEHCKIYEDAGVDQVIFIQQGGNNKHEHILDSLELFASDVMPPFKERAAAREQRKQEDLAPYIEQADVRKREREGDPNGFEPPIVPSYGRTIAEGTPGGKPIADRSVHDSHQKVL